MLFDAAMVHLEVIYLVLILLATGSANDESQKTEGQRHQRRKGAYSNLASNPTKLPRDQSNNAEAAEKHNNRVQNPVPAQAPISSLPLTQFSYGYAISDHDNYSQNQNQRRNEARYADFQGGPYNPYNHYQQYTHDSGRGAEPLMAPPSETRKRMPHMMRAARPASPVPHQSGHSYSPTMASFRSLPQLAPPVVYFAEPGVHSSGELGLESE